MKKSIFILLTGIFVFVLSACEKIPQTIESQVMAYRLNESQKSEYGLIENKLFKSENVLSYDKKTDEILLRIFSAPIENYGNVISLADDGTYSTSGSYIQKELPELWSDERPIRITSGELSVALMPVLGEYTSVLDKEIDIFGQTRDSVIYQNAFGKNVNLKCSTTSFGINLEIVLLKPPENNTFRLRIQLPGLIPVTDSPDYILFRTAMENGGVKAALYTPLVADKNGKWSYSNSVELVEKDSVTDTYIIEYKIDDAFLRDKSIKYPVTLNQSFHFYIPCQPDTSAYENTGDEAGHWKSPYLLLGDSTVKGEGWAYIRYEVLDLLKINWNKIISARYVFRNLFDLKKEAEISAYAVTADWCSINTRWSSRPDYDETPISQTSVKTAGDYSLDITPLFREMIKNKGNPATQYSVNNSFMIKCNTPNSNIILASGDSGVFSPFLEITLAK